MRSSTPVSWCRHFPAWALLALMLPSAVGVGPAHADLFFFKDGTVIEGRVKREMTLEFDQVARDAYFMPHGFFYLRDVSSSALHRSNLSHKKTRPRKRRFPARPRSPRN
jgi:hypothetical protein